MAALALGPADMIARKTGEGYERPQGDQLMPLDINYKTLVQWLASRQKLVADWSKRLAAIQAKASDLFFKELKPELIAQLRGGPEAPLDYLRAVEIRDALAKTAERTLFGGLTGPAAEWDKVVKAYDKGGGSVSLRARVLLPTGRRSPGLLTLGKPHSLAPQASSWGRRLSTWCRTQSTSCPSCASRCVRRAGAWRWGGGAARADYHAALHFVPPPP